MALMIKTDIYNFSNFPPKLCEARAKLEGIRVFYLNDVYVLFEELLIIQIHLLKRAILAAAIFAPLQSVIHGQKPHELRKAL